MFLQKTEIPACLEDAPCFAASSLALLGRVESSRYRRVCPYVKYSLICRICYALKSIFVLCDILDLCLLFRHHFLDPSHPRPPYGDPPCLSYLKAGTWESLDSNLRLLSLFPLALCRSFIQGAVPPTCSFLLSFLAVCRNPPLPTC